MDKLNYLSAEARKYANKYIAIHGIKILPALERMSVDDLEKQFTSQVMQEIINKQSWQKKKEAPEEVNNPKKKQSKPREYNPPPEEFELYSNMSAYYTRDTRINGGAFRCLNLINGFCGKRNFTNTTVASLAYHLGVASRTIHRYLEQLRAVGAIWTERVNSPETGMTTCLKINLGLLVRKCFSILNKGKKLVKQGMTSTSHTLKKICNQQPKMSDFNVRIYKKGKNAFLS